MEAPKISISSTYKSSKKYHHRENSASDFSYPVPKFSCPVSAPDFSRSYSFDNPSKARDSVRNSGIETKFLMSYNNGFIEPTSKECEKENFKDN